MDRGGGEAMTARDKFNLGDRVKLSAEGRAFFAARRKHDKLGTVVGFGLRRISPVVGIRLDGNKSIYSYHADFWEMA
jgi:hypothetical protein